MPTDRTYPAADGVDTWYAGKSSAVSSKDDVAVGTHVGPASAGGVSPASAFDGYTPVHKIDSPSDGINDSANYVVYFSKDDADPKELFKATDGDISTLTALTSGTEYDAFYGFTA
jgi:hypothetical protein|tara:strand:+ start:145 stop:489 length:345 start_codon:yes stop_codon:yes gene_type:complete